MKGEAKLWGILNDKLETLLAANRFPEALRVAKTALDLAERSFADSDPARAISHEKVGHLLGQTGDHTAARNHLLNAYAVWEKAEPPDKHALFRSARRLAFLSDQSGQSEEAVRFYEKAIAIGGELDDLPYSDMGTMLNNVALIFRKTGRQKAAEPYYLHALSIYEKQLGPNHPDVASVLNNLAVFYTNERRFAEAEKIHLRALTIREKALPPTHSDIAQSKCNLAVVYHSRGDYSRAAELYRASLDTWEATTAKPPQDYEIVASNYADLLRSLGQARKAQQLETRARKRRRGS
jgi:tetratricopeptide (TPR) repeat protein